MKMTCNLKDLPTKSPARIINMHGDPHIIQCLMNLGIRNSIFIKVVGKLFFGSNYIIEVLGERLVLRKHEAQCLQVTTSS